MPWICVDICDQTKQKNQTQQKTQNTYCSTWWKALFLTAGSIISIPGWYCFRPKGLISQNMSLVQSDMFYSEHAYTGIKS